MTIRNAVCLFLMLARRRGCVAGDTRPSLESGSGTRAASSSLPSIFGAAGREVTIREARSSIRHDSPTAVDWYSPGGERILEKFLSHLERDEKRRNGEGDESQRMVRGLRRGEVDLEGLWLLCRAQLGCIEAVLLALGEASDHVAYIRSRWRKVKKFSASLYCSDAVNNAATRIANVLKQATRRTPHDSLIADETSTTPLGVGDTRTRLALGMRRRALLRSEISLACHAGSLHDLRLALADGGGEWLELGRWIGGPPLPSMPWDAQPCRQQQEFLLRTCSQVLAQLRATEESLRRLGPFGLFNEAFPLGMAGAKAEPLDASRGSLVAATRTTVELMKGIRKAVKVGQPAAELVPPSILARHSLIWLGLVSLLGYSYNNWLPMLYARREEVLQAAVKTAGDVQRFWGTHVTEPLKGIATELFHGYEPTIDPRQVKETREALVRMLEEFTRDYHKASDGEAKLDEALRLAAQGSMDSVTAAFEEQVRSPMSSLLGGGLIRSMLIMMQQLRLLLEEEVESIDSLLRRNDFNLQVMATVPALFLVTTLLIVLRSFWRKLRSSDRALRDPIEAMQAEAIAIDALLSRAELAPKGRGEELPRFQRCALSHYEVTPMDLSEVGELIFRVQRLRRLGRTWLRGVVRTEVLHDSQVLLDSSRLSATQRARVVENLHRRLENIDAFRDHW